MTRPKKTILDQTFLAAALEGLTLQKARLEEQIRQVKTMMGKAPRQTNETQAGSSKPRKRTLSTAARKSIALAQKKRWAAFRKQKDKAAAN